MEVSSIPQRPGGCGSRMCGFPCAVYLGYWPYIYIKRMFSFVLVGVIFVGDLAGMSLKTCIFMLDEHDKSIMKDQPGRMFQVFMVRLNHKHYLNCPSGLVKLMAPFWDLHPFQCFILYILYIYIRIYIYVKVYVYVYIIIYIHKYLDCIFWNQMLVHWC